jgi:hypothetical protein
MAFGHVGSGEDQNRRVTGEGDLMSPSGLAILSAVVTVLGVVIAGWFELRKARIAVTREVTPGANLLDTITNIKESVDKLDTKVDQQSERLVRVETIVNNEHLRRRRTDRK